MGTNKPVFEPVFISLTLYHFTGLKVTKMHQNQYKPDYVWISIQFIKNVILLSCTLLVVQSKIHQNEYKQVYYTLFPFLEAVDENPFCNFLKTSWLLQQSVTIGLFLVSYPLRKCILLWPCLQYFTRYVFVFSTLRDVALSSVLYEICVISL